MSQKNTITANSVYSYSGIVPKERALSEANRGVMPQSQEAFLSFLEPPFVILELVPYGDLLGYLKKSVGEHDDYYNTKTLQASNFKVSTEQLFGFSLDIALGMEFISAHKVRRLGTLFFMRQTGSGEKSYTVGSLSFYLLNTFSRGFPNH